MQWRYYGSTGGLDGPFVPTVQQVWSVRLLESIKVNLVFNQGNYLRFLFMVHSLFPFYHKALTPSPHLVVLLLLYVSFYKN